MRNENSERFVDNERYAGMKQNRMEETYLFVLVLLAVVMYLSI